MSLFWMGPEIDGNRSSGANADKSSCELSGGCSFRRAVNAAGLTQSQGRRDSVPNVQRACAHIGSRLRARSNGCREAPAHERERATLAFTLQLRSARNSDPLNGCTRAVLDPADVQDIGGLPPRMADFDSAQRVKRVRSRCRQASRYRCSPGTWLSEQQQDSSYPPTK